MTPATTRAGAFDSPLTFEFARADREQYLDQISSKLPPGLLGLISRVPQCAAAAAAAGGCPAASRIGTAGVLAGAGSSPITQTGAVFLTGPYAGAPFGLAIVIPAIAGPFDLGSVTVRAAIEVGRTTAQLTIASAPLPQVVGGIPLRIRHVDVTIDRSGFMLNPTSCAASPAAATLTGAQGAAASATSPFQATDCGALRFAPTLNVSLTGKGQTAPGKHPSVIATLTSGLGQANLRSASVTLPLSLALDPNNSSHVCPVAASQIDACPASTRIGSATVKTPILTQPLTGPVYLVQGIRTDAEGQQIRTLPALLITLRGQVALDLHAQTSVDSRSRLVTTFAAVPDAPITRFALKISGGRHGVLVVTGDKGLCRRVQTGRATLDSQSGLSESRSLKLATPCARGERVTRLGVRGHTVRVRVAVPAAGRLRVSGRGLTPAARSVPKATTVAFVIHLSVAEQARLRREGAIKVRLRIRYTRKGAGAGAQTIVTRAVRLRR